MARYRQASISFLPPLTPAVKYLVVSTSAAFVLTYVPWVLGWYNPLVLFGLTPSDVTHRLFVWQLGTYLFLHGNFFQVLFNMYALWVFGADLERQWGKRRFLFYYFLTGMGAGVVDVLVQPSSPVPTIGCSGAVYGLLLAFGLLFPERLIFYAFIIPMKAKWFVVLMGAIEFLSSLTVPGSGISHVAHLGGMAFGYFYLRGGGLSYRLQLRYHQWRRARLRKRFEVYVRKQEKKDDAGRWVN
jgi:rhomboid family protein